jgi:hypothetical protein
VNLLFGQEEGRQMADLFPCQGCGFLVLDGPHGTFAICPICGWEDDNVQASDPSYASGANGISLADHREGVLRRLPATVREHAGFRRDSGWLAGVARAAPDAEPGAPDRG